MKPDKYKFTQLKNRFKEKVKPMKKIHNEFCCSECNEAMSRNEFINSGGICLDCMNFKQQENEEIIDERDMYDIEYDH